MIHPMHFGDLSEGGMAVTYDVVRLFSQKPISFPARDCHHCGFTGSGASGFTHAVTAKWFPRLSAVPLNGGSSQGKR